MLVGAGIGASGNESTKTTTSTKTITAQGTTTTATVKAAQAPAFTNTVVHTQTVDRTVTSPAPASKPAESSSAGKSFSGSGTKSLGTITVAKDSTIHWKAKGGFFYVSNDPTDSRSISLSSQASSGESAIEAGTYHKVDVNAVGEWSFTIKPG